ncbi:snRNA-activating protein complex subunit 4 [Leptopilina boulardi]|uniref:snRNA-activating protein complex subunit 4 n=1 Tax=Leptopilina boulardi TaxID=63433 RepID=UPI0021F5DD12|nr:snRNA-activating protein complex subunit 4 [Leptopilina boulardi]XP_051155067.1 snRNA-activating protein complex subunit 4 [Leptopilina boulardi]
MSDAEDDMILEEIRALENALSRKNDETEEYSLNNLKTEVIHCQENIEETIIEERHSPIPESILFINNENLSGPSALALELNKQLIQRLQVTREQIATLLEECKRKKEIIGQKLKQRMKTSNIKTITSHAGMPYFKTKEYFAAPPNEDTKLKEARGELQIIHLRRVLRWTAKDKELLLKSIHREVVETMRYMPGNEKIDLNSIKLGKNAALPDIIVREIGEMGEREFDWMKIAVSDFQNKHSPEECRVMWNIFLHPSINKFKWKKKELVDLEKYAKQYKNENWDKIAEKLGTHRSGYQCFVKYNTMKKMPQNDKPWSKQEDRKLIQLINKFKIGDFINWGDIASCMKTRTKHQIYFRWMYSLAPHLKKGRFTEDEDKLFLDAIEKYGLNFKKISALVLPARTSAQLSDHYNTLTNKDDNSWTVDQDMKLLQLHKEHGKNWSKIATFFDNKSRVQLRHRCTALSRYEQRGMDLQQIPRNNYRDKIVNKDIVVFHKITTKNQNDFKDLDEIDMEIINYFQSVNIPMTKSGRKKKYYTPSELDLATRKMYNILNLMSANLTIPYDLDEYDCLNERDKQILYALKNIRQDAINGKMSEKIEETRLRLFNNSENLTENHFVPPLPFGGYTRTHKYNQMINYSLYIDTVFTENRNWQFETPENIIKLIGETMNEQYDKIGNLMTKPSNIEDRRLYQKIYILGPNELMKKENAPCHSRQIHNLFHSLPTRSRLLVSDTKLSPDDVNYHTRKMESDMENFPSFKPCYSTLLGYQGIESVRKTVNATQRILIDEEIELLKMSEFSRWQLMTLRTRLVQLFKFPIIMSQIMPPESIEERDCLFVDKKVKKTKICAQSTRKRKIAKLEVD